MDEKVDPLVDHCQEIIESPTVSFNIIFSPSHTGPLFSAKTSGKSRTLIVIESETEHVIPFDKIQRYWDEPEGEEQWA